jgi:hypothetical protein
MTALSKPFGISTKAVPAKTVPIKAKPRVSAKVVVKTASVMPAAQTAMTAQAKTLVSPVKVTASSPESKAPKVLKPKKIKLVRDSFTIPKSEYLVLDDLKLRAAELKHPVKKGELLRAGIKALAAMTTAQFHSALQAVPALKTGRPSK